MIKILLFFITLSFLSYSQDKSNYLDFLANNTSINLEKLNQYDKIYFVRFDYCSGSNYCGKNNFHLLVDTSKMSNTLFIIDTIVSKSRLPLYMSNKNIIYVDRNKLMRKGLFFSKTILIEKKN